MRARLRPLTSSDSRYPPLLAELHDPPAELYVRGSSVGALLDPAVAVVGARSCSGYGAQAARSLARSLAVAGVVVVSGLARGIDSEAHRGALEGGGETIAVLGCGIDRTYPRANAQLADQVGRSGLLVSEYPPGVEPAPWRFPARNRIIAGLCLATVIVEARTKSGALITADFALELGREVFAVPGEITSALSGGTNDLIRQGAVPLLSAEDVLGAIGIEATPPSTPAADLGPVAAELLVLLQDQPLGIDELARASGRSSAEVGAALVELELGRCVRGADGIFRAVS